MEMMNVTPRKKQPLKKGYFGTLDQAEKDSPQNRILLGIPLTGLVRAEWMMARYGQVIPCNWSQVDMIQWLDAYSPLRYSVADARNIVASVAIMNNHEWVCFIDHDVVLPPTFILKMNEYILKGDIPIVGGLYFTRGVPSEPLIYRGGGNSYYQDWKFGDKVWVSGMGLGCHIIHVSILKALSEESEVYGPRGHKCWRIFETPAKSWFDPESASWHSQVGTEDLEFYHRIVENDILTKAGWPKIAKKGEFPFLCDTSMFCKHIDMDGMQYPRFGEEIAFMDKKAKKTFGIK
jgi:hypothetical protein